MRHIFLVLALLLPLSAQETLLNVWEGNVLIREERDPGRRRVRLIKEVPGRILGQLEAPEALQPPAGQVLHVAHLDGISYAWGRTQLNTPQSRNPQPKSTDEQLRTWERSTKLEYKLGRFVLYRSRDFRTWERLAFGPPREEHLECLHPLRDGTFLGSNSQGLSGGGTVARFHIGEKGMLQQVGPFLAWGPAPILKGRGFPAPWAYFQGEDTLLVDTHLGGWIALDLQEGNLRWRSGETTDPGERGWELLIHHRQMGSDGRLLILGSPLKPRTSYPPEVHRGAGLVISSHMAERKISLASRLVAQALNSRLRRGWGDYQKQVRVQFLDPRSGARSWGDRNQLKVTRVDALASYWGRATEISRDPLANSVSQYLTFRADGSVELHSRTAKDVLGWLRPWNPW